MAYSNSSGGTLTLPSPTHVHHVDVTAAVRSLRRSISRSPSRFNLVRTTSDGSDGSVSSPQSPSPAPQSSCPQPDPRLNSSQVASHSPPSSLSSQAANTTTPFKPSVKLSVRSARSKAPTPKPPLRNRPSPKSPLKRAFGITADSGNSTAEASGVGDAQGQENSFNNFALALSPASRRTLEKPSRHSVHLDTSGTSKFSFSKFLEAKYSSLSSNVSPLKRSDAIMNPDHSNFGSPVAKRRSLHGISVSGGDLNIFDFAPRSQESFNIHEDATQGYELTSAGMPSLQDPLPSPTPNALARRSSSLRKKTLQQRTSDRSSWGRRQGEQLMAQISNEVASPIPKARPRLSLDQYVPPDPRDSPFTSQGSLPNASVHLLDRPNHQPHPLSRSLTQSSSSSSVMDESPTHIPVPALERPRAPLNFSKSLPPGATRPRPDPPNQAVTPKYKSALPNQAAFMSTGLVSKRNWHPQPEGPRFPAKPTIMPDTPCKKQVYPSNTYPPQSGSGRRQSRPSFDSPTTPFNSQAVPFLNTFGNHDRGGGLFKQLRSSHARKTSMVSADGDDHGDSQAVVDGDLPPTPTKHVLSTSFGSSSRFSMTPVSRNIAVPVSAVASGTDTLPNNPSCKSILLKNVLMNGDFRSDSAGGLVILSPPARSVGSSSELPALMPSFMLSRATRESFSTPAPLEAVSTTPPKEPIKPRFTKVGCLDPASPLDRVGFMEKSSPTTPQDTMMPPDPSRLSISNSRNGKQASASRGERKSSCPPATPTTNSREYFPEVGNRRVSMTPINGHSPTDIDEALMNRFVKSELVGAGEFSQVFRVVKFSVSGSLSPFSSTSSKRTPRSPGEDRVYAVKKIRLPLYGTKGREAKLREVSILKALRHCDHVIHIVDDWEQNYHLYVQTEYCEEGSLDKFLRNVGETGRLDDFRIWKILLETGLGLQAIHDSGFIHLDLKPANIFITYEGILKIGDFGMATPWPAQKGIDGEGDREYMGPEVLNGKYDKPADIFSLGLVLLEMACNVFLPDNGPTWQALREGDLSVVPSLTWSDASGVIRDATGTPIAHDSGISPMNEVEELDAKGSLRSNDSRRGFPFEFSDKSFTHNPSNLFGTIKRAELQNPPAFMVDAHHPNSLDSVARWMMKPDPVQRPTAHQLLNVDALTWVSGRRRAGATVFEGNWGPEDEVLVDTEMTDV